jgi:mono/diheme cytochrome c family protein
MRRALFAAIGFAALTGAASAQDLQRFDLIERGRYLAVLGDCAACHTAPGGQPYAGGLALQTPFGKLVAPNITPDRETGIGNWTEDEFVAAMRDGRGRGGKRLYPAMPYPAYTKMTRDDALSIRAYLATVNPVSHAVEVNQLPFPFNIRLSLVFWNALNFTPGRYQPNPQKSAEWNRGAYIVEGAAHCGTCHTPKTFLGGDKSDAPLAGATLQGWFAPNITTDPRVGIGGWSKDDLIEYLKTGTNAWTLASGPMAEAVFHSTSKMTDADIAAIATYLKDSGVGAAAPKPVTVALDGKAMRAGAAIYKDSWRPVTGIPATERSTSSHVCPAARWCNRTIRRRSCVSSCRGRARCPHPPSRRLPRCRHSTGGSMTTRRPPFSRTSGTAGEIRRRRYRPDRSQARVRHWRALPDVCRLQGPPIVR